MVQARAIQSLFLRCYFCRIDATDSKYFGRFLNDSTKPNVIPKVIIVDEKPKVCFFACKTIDIGDEIVYNYGAGNYDWR